MPSPTARSMELLRGQGYHVAKVEHWNSFARIRQDLWGADVIAFRSDVGPIPPEHTSFAWPILLVQATVASSGSARTRKLLANSAARDWVHAGHEVRVDAWAKRGPRGKRKVWTCVSDYLTEDRFTKEVTRSER